MGLTLVLSCYRFACWTSLHRVGTIYSDKEDAEKMVSDFRKASFPKLVASAIAEKDGVTVLEVVKEFGVDVNAMKFE